ncbi:protein of unknown function DUF971 [Trinorchestia longiramus]|nr:protein of unknown function DUF971 [Trinorchestia longiramus]
MNSLRTRLVLPLASYLQPLHRPHHHVSFPTSACPIAAAVPAYCRSMTATGGLCSTRKLIVDPFLSSAAHMSSTTGATQVKLVGVNILHRDKMVQVKWSSGGSSTYPWLWLRDNCQCPDCFHPISLSRTFRLKDLDTKLVPSSIKVAEDGSELMSEWCDGHISVQKAAWLHVRAFEDKQKAQRRLINKLPKKSWPDELPQADWTAVMQNEDSLLLWLVQLETYGIVIINNGPLEQGRITELADRVAFVKQTHYGKDFSVIAKPEPSNVAYSSDPLALHLDLPYYFYKPGVQFIHCVRQHEGEGGDTQVSDALEVAQFLRSEKPRMFQMLSSVPVDWVDHANEGGRQYFKMLTMPVICLESDGETIWRINFSQPQRDSYFSGCCAEQVHDWYEALKTYHDLLYDRQFCRTFKLASGSIMTLDNVRVTHGRTGYPKSSEVNRHIDGCYVDWDEVRSRRRVLTVQHRHDDGIYRGL